VYIEKLPEDSSVKKFVRKIDNLGKAKPLEIIDKTTWSLGQSYYVCDDTKWIKIVNAMNFSTLVSFSRHNVQIFLAA
jgi:hypothetical protein